LLIRVALTTILALIAVAGLHGRALLPQSTRSCEVPATPTNLSTVVDTATHTLTLTWKQPVASAAPTNHSVEVGNAPGSTYLGTLDTGSAKTSFTSPRPLDPGVYFVRVRAVNACGVSGVSPEMRVSVDPDRIGARTRPDVVVVRRTATRNTYFPTAALMKSGEIVVVYYDSPDHVSSAGRISMVRSRDDGRTWSMPAVVVDGPNDERDPNIVETARGTWLVSYFESDSAKSPTSQGVFVIRSTDEGKTWSVPAKVATTLVGAATSAKIVQLDNGDLLLPVYGGKPGGVDAVAAVIRSADDGMTWSPESEAMLASAPGVNFVEPALGYLGGGRLLAMVRTEGAERAAFESYSLDGGRTWSAATRTELIAQASDLLPVVDDQKSLLVHTWGDTSGRFGNSRPTVMQVIQFREFPTARWTDEPRLLHAGHCWSDEGYPSSVRLRDGRVFTVYYDACAGYIGGTFSKLTDPAASADCSDPPPPPADLKGASSTGGDVALTWTATPVTRTYVLEAGKTSGAADALTVDVGAQTNYNASKVNPGTYYIRVRSRNACGTSDASNEVVVIVS
jgi:hypothetical protein